MNFKLVWKKELADGETAPGINSVIWEAVNSEGHVVANGTYLMKITTKNKTVLKKIGLVR